MTNSKKMPGDKLRIPAELWNRVVSATEWVERQMARVGGGIRDPLNRLEVRVRNDSGVVVPRFGLLELDEPLFEREDFIDWNERPAFKGIKPTRLAAGRVAVARDYIEPGQLGVCWASGVVPMQVDQPPDLDVDLDTMPGMNFVDVLPDSVAKAQAGRSGFGTILGGTLDDWCYVLLGPPGTVRVPGRLKEALTAPTSAANALDNPPVAKFELLVPKLEGTNLNWGTTYTPFAWQVASPAVEMRLVNRDENLTASSGAFVKVEWLHGEWSPYWVSC